MLLSPSFLLTFFHFLFLVLFAALFHLLSFSTLLSWLIRGWDEGPHHACYQHKAALILLLVTKVKTDFSCHEDSFHTSNSLEDRAASIWNNEGFGPVAVWTELYNYLYFIFYFRFSLCLLVCVYVNFTNLLLFQVPPSTVFTNGGITFEFFPHISWKLPAKRSKAFLCKTDCLNSWNTSYMCLSLL